MSTEITRALRFNQIRVLEIQGTNVGAGLLKAKFTYHNEEGHTFGSMDWTQMSQETLECFQELLRRIEADVLAHICVPPDSLEEESPFPLASRYQDPSSDE